MRYFLKEKKKEEEKGAHDTRTCILDSKSISSMGKTFMIGNFEIATEGSKAPLKFVVMENQLTIQHDSVSYYQNGHSVFQTRGISMTWCFL